jgi:hypothetical protein
MASRASQFGSLSRSLYGGRCVVAQSTPSVAASPKFQATSPPPSSPQPDPHHRQNSLHPTRAPKGLDHLILALHFAKPIRMF